MLMERGTLLLEAFHRNIYVHSFCLDTIVLVSTPDLHHPQASENYQKWIILIAIISIVPIRSKLL